MPSLSKLVRQLDRNQSASTEAGVTHYAYSHARGDHPLLAQVFGSDTTLGFARPEKASPNFRRVDQVDLAASDPYNGA